MAEFDATKMDNAAKEADAELEQIKELHRISRRKGRTMAIKSNRLESMK